MTTPTQPAPDREPTERAAAANAAYGRFRHSGDPTAIADLFDLAADGLFRTALHLVGDDATAHDLVQVTFLAALEQKTFDGARDVLPWLGGILKNQAVLVHRRRARQLAAERLQPEPSEDPAAAAAARETQAQVESALRRLPQVYEPVVRMHLLDGQDAATIALTLRRPGGTVRTQLVRGLERLRGLLPIGLGGLLAGLLPTGGRAAVRQAVIAAAGGGTAAGAGAGVGVATAWWLRPRALLLAALGAAAIALTVLFAQSGVQAPPMSVVPTAALAPASVASSPEANAASPAASVVAGGERTAAPVVADVEFTLRGVVTGTVRGTDGQPIEGAEVMLWAGTRRPLMRDRTLEPPPAATALTARDGTFALQGRGAQCYLLARTADAISEHGIEGDLQGRAQVDGLELRLQPLALQRGIVLDPDGHGVADQPVFTDRGSSTSSSDRLPVIGFRRCELPDLAARTDAAGEFAVRAAQDYRYPWVVEHPDHPRLFVRHKPADGSLELRLERGRELSGVAWRSNGAPAQGAEVALHESMSRRATCAADGSFLLRGFELRDGTWLRVDDPMSAICCVPVTEAMCARRLEVRLEPPQALGGRVVDDAGQPLAGIEVHIVGDRLIDTGAVYGEPGTWERACGNNRATTATDGAFRFERLYDGMFAIELREPGGVEFVTVATSRAGIVDLELPIGRARQQRATFAGHLRDALSHAPITAAKVTVWRRGAAGDWNGRGQDVDAPDGVYELPGIAVGEVRLSFAAVGYASVDLPATVVDSGRHVLDVDLHPQRSLEIEVHGLDRGEYQSGRIGAHLGDERWLQLRVNRDMTSARIDVHDGKVRLDGLPARMVTIVFERGRDDAMAQTIDLTQPPTAPMVFELAAAPPPPPRMHLGILVFAGARGADPASWAGKVDREWLLRVQQSGSVRPLATAATITVATADGKRVATGSIAPAAQREGDPAGEQRFACRVEQADGTGQSSEAAPFPAVSLNLRAEALVVRVEADGYLPFERRLTPAELQGADAAIAAVLLPR